MGVRILFGLGAVLWTAVGCSTSSNLQEKTKFTKIDSLTDTYLVLQDSLLQSWNRMVKAESEKTQGLQEVLAQLSPNLDDQEMAEAFQSRIEQLERIRFTQKSLGNMHVVDEYDRAFESIVEDLQRLKGEMLDADLQTLFSKVEMISKSQQQKLLQRSHYDSLAAAFNQFVETNKKYLEEIERNVHLESKPLFKADTPK